MINIRPLLFTNDIYKGFDVSDYKLDLQGWGSFDENFESLIDKTKPNLILEIGTWKGASAINMANICERYKLNTQIICIDTWLGALEFWTNKQDPERYLSLDLRFGYPNVFLPIYGKCNSIKKNRNNHSISTNFLYCLKVVQAYGHKIRFNIY